MQQKGDIEIPLIPRKTSSAKKGKEYSDDNVIIPVKQPTFKPKHKSNFLEFLDPASTEEKYAPRASFFKWLTFIDMMPYVKRMNLMFKKFDITDIPKPEKGFNVENKLIKLDYEWMNELKKDKPSFSSALSRTFHNEIIQAIILSFLDNATKIYYSIYMGKIINVITSNEVVGAENTGELVTSATLLSLLVLVSIFTKNWAFFTVVSNTGRARLAISGMLYKKLNSTSLTSLQELKLGKVINLLGNDLNDLQGLNNVLAMVVNPFVIALSTYMLWEYFGASCLIGLVSLALIIFVQIFLSNRTEVPRKENKKTIDERVKITHEVIEGIRLIKMYAWEKLFKQKVLRLRENEHATFRKIARIDAVGRNFSALSVYLNILILCIFYTAVGGILSPDKIYASMMILMYLGSSLVSSHQGRMSLVNFRMIMTRVEEVLAVEDVVDENLPAKLASVKTDNNKPTVTYKNFTGYWTKAAQKPVLSDISFTLHPGTLTAVIGKIGCGKTSLLFSFLKELPMTTGTADCHGKLGYVEQDPIIFSGTFRENILFGREYDEALYKQVLQDCQLDIDLKNFPHGDQTRIGERGINLSGGQKARVSLARAFYSQSDVYLLDDPFSALDSTVARDLFNKLMKETIEKNKTTLLVTHHLHFAKEAHHVILLSEGRVEGQGTFADLEKLNTSLLSIFKGFSDRKMSTTSEDGEVEEEKGKNVDQVVSKTQEKGNREEAAEVSWKTYKDYFSVKGTWNVVLTLTVLFIIPHTITVYFARILGFWAEEQTRFYSNPENADKGMAFDHAYYITICVIMLLVIYVFSYAKARVVNDFLLDTNSTLHKTALDVLIRAKTLFFDINPVGRILNRFSNDLGSLDKNNARMVFEFVDGTIGQVSLLATVCIINPAIIAPTILVFYGLYKARMFFAKPMFLAKKLELASKSPMLSTIPATLQGLIIIRIYNQGGRFVREFMDMVYVNTKTLTFLTKTMRLFAFVLDTPIQFLTISGIWIFIIVMFNYEVEAGLLGLSLMYLLRIGSHSTQMIRQSLQIDINMQSAQRILDYCQTPSEAADFAPAKDTQVEEDFRGQWPVKGEIVLNKVFLRYREGLDFALKGLTLKIQGGLKVACVGRTGAGKSSIIQALFRMVEIETGRDYNDSYISIDGVDIGSVGLNLLRRKLSIIPQVPVVFADTIKKNLDPFGRLTDEELWKVLEEVGLKDYVASLPKKLDTDMTVSTTVFSAGQKQLICLARVIISQSKVIILDEATANVDIETDHFIQRTIMEKFKHCTILTIAHRLITIANYDKVVVIDNGNVVQYDAPYALLVEQIGDNEITKKDGMFADMVRSTGKSMAKKVFEVAKLHYFKKHE